jgi:hypothetical protein
MIKRRGRNQIENLILDHKSLENKGLMKFDWDMQYAVGKTFLRALRYYLQIFKIDLI